MAADYMNKVSNPFCIMAQCQIETINDKMSVIEVKIIEKESNLKCLISKDNKTKGIMCYVKEVLECIINVCNLDTLDETQITMVNQIAEEIN